MRTLMLVLVLAVSISPAVSAGRKIQTLAFADSIELSTTLIRGPAIYLGRLDQRGRLTAGIGRIFNWDFLPGDGEMSIVPQASMQFRVSQTPLLELSLNQEWYQATSSQRAPSRYTTRFEVRGDLLMQSGFPTVVRLSQGFTTFDRRSRGLSPKTQGIRLEWLFVSLPAPDMYDVSDSGIRTKKAVTPTNQSQSVFFAWPAGLGLVKVHIGLGRRRNPQAILEPEDPEAILLRPWQHPAVKKYLIYGLWKIEYSVQR